MLNKLLGKKEKKTKDNTKELQEYLSKIGVSEIRSLLLGQVEKFPVDEVMIVEILKKMTHEDAKTEKKFLESSDNDIKLKKAFDTVITAAYNKKITIAGLKYFSNR